MVLFAQTMPLSVELIHLGRNWQMLVHLVMMVAVAEVQVVLVGVTRLLVVQMSRLLVLLEVAMCGVQ